MIRKTVQKHKMGRDFEIRQNLEYWLSRPPEERIEAVEILRRQVYGVLPRLGKAISKNRKRLALYPARSMVDIYLDFKRFLELLNAHKVDYLIVGGYALAFHGAPRVTGDIDLFVKPDSVNARRILRALAEIGFESLDLWEKDFMVSGNVIELGVPPVRVDIMTSLTGVSWETVQAGKVSGSCGEVVVFYIGKKDLIANKKSLGRTKDLADIEALGDK